MCDFTDCEQYKKLSCSDLERSIFLKPACYRPSDKPCLGCAMADTLLSMAVTAHRERLLTMDNKQCDQVFDKIVDYLAKKYPVKGGCPALD